jgi:hypothetical protein
MVAKGSAVRILDIDLDFFLDHRPLFKPQSRPHVAASTPWSADRVRQFLEQRCGLDRNNPLPGRTVTYHHEVFFDWGERIQRGSLSVPFSVLHVDWHADLGMGEATPGYVLTALLDLPLDQRRRFDDERRQRLTPGNFLLFALACRWIDHLTYVYNPNRRDMDVPAYCMRHGDFASGHLQLPHYPPHTALADIIALRAAPSAWEPAVPFELVSGADLSVTQPFSAIYLTQSPDYTPPEADRLIALIEEYMA